MSTGRARTRTGAARRQAVVRALLAAALALSDVSAVAQEAEVIELEGISIIGNPELPKTITLVPWKRALPGALAGEPEGSLLREQLNAIDPPVFRRELRYFEAGFAIE